MAEAVEWNDSCAFKALVKPAVTQNLRACEDDTVEGWYTSRGRA
jgi:hypothetical protein